MIFLRWINSNKKIIIIHELLHLKKNSNGAVQEDNVKTIFYVIPATVVKILTSMSIFTCETSCFFRNLN